MAIKMRVSSPQVNMSIDSPAVNMSVDAAKRVYMPGGTGNGIKSVIMNEDYTLTLILDDGTSYTTPSIRGPKGEPGYTPQKGVDYFDGEDAEVVQNLGESEDKAISQKVVTSHLNDHEERLTTLEKEFGLVSFVTDSTIAYSKTVPADALTFAEINKIGGMTYKVNVGTEDEPIYELRSAPVTEVESVGVNLFDISKLIETDMLKVSGDKINVTSGEKTPINSINKLIEVAPQLKVGDVVMLNATTTGERKYIYLDKANMTWNYGGKKTVTEDMLNSKISFYSSGAYSSATISEFIISKVHDAPYTPYSHSTLPIPEAIRNLEGYGWGINESVYNYVDFENKQFVKRVGKDGEMFYELETPEIIDISHLFFGDNYIEVEAGGTVTMVNEHQYAVPSEITYQIRRVT